MKKGRGGTTAWRSTERTFYQSLVPDIHKSYLYLTHSFFRTQLRTCLHTLSSPGDGKQFHFQKLHVVFVTLSVKFRKQANLRQNA
jgi:hypothetical protein